MPKENTLYYIILIIPLVVACLLVITLILLVGGYWIPAVTVLAIAVLINWRTKAFALNFRSSQNSEKGKVALKVLTYNLNRAYSTSVNNGSEQDVINLIKEQEADIVLLQEFNPTLYSEINEGLKKSYPHGTLNDEGNRFKSVFSRYPISDYQQLTSNGETQPICVMRVEINGRTCYVVTCHLMSNNFSVVYREIKGQDLRLIAGIKKVNHSIRQGCAIRRQQVDVLLDYLKEIDAPVLICGDFNDIAKSVTLQKFSKGGFSDAWWNRGFGFGFTYWGMKMRFRLDHILYNERLTPSWIRVVHSNLSDHRPLVASFSVK